MESSESTTLVVVDPVTKRVSGLLREMGILFSHMDKRDFLARQINIILDAVREELEEDTHLFDNQSGRMWLLSFGKLIEWTVTGDRSQIPPELMPVVDAIEGTDAHTGIGS
jgi:hypothetical protein